MKNNKIYLDLIAKGHSEEWAYQMIDTSEEGERAVIETYSSIVLNNPELAKRELLIHCRSMNGDSYFERHYLKLFEVGVNPDGIIQMAKDYSEIIKEQLSKGKSEIYAHEYADLMADGEYNKIYCEEYAFAFENALNQKKTIDYARIYAGKYGDAVVDIKRRTGYDDEKEAIDFAIEKVNAFMHAWEYVKSNKLEDFERFAAIYESVHLNTYFADTSGLENDKDEIDNKILKRALEKFNR